MATSDDSGNLAVVLRFLRHVLHPLLILLSAGCLLALVGWTGFVTGWQHWTTCLVGILFGIERCWILVALRPHGRERLRLICHAIPALAVAGLGGFLLFTHEVTDGHWPIGWHVSIQVAVLVSGLASLIHHQTRFTARAFHPGWLLIGSFFTVIVIGTLLLKMPRCVVEGAHCTWLDAAFTSTSAVCVTGLVVENTATFFSPTGQVVILLLIQIGGLGIMTLTFFAAVVLFEGLSLHDHLLLGKMIQENRLSRLSRTLTFIVLLTFSCELIGAVVLFLGMDPSLSQGERWFQSAFHSVSAFCNAGFSTLPDGMASEVVAGNRIWQGCVMGLVVIGGIGALVVEDLTQWLVAKFKSIMKGQRISVRLRVHTRLVLAATGILIVGGAVAIYATEFLLWDGPVNADRIFTSVFHSITARTAGFNTVPMGAIAPLTIQILMVLMIIGGSPGGTAGGLRTTVFAVALGHLWNQIRTGRRGMVVFNRTIPPETGTQALGLIVLVVMWLAINFVVLQFLQAGSGISETRLLFELISAFATVGLSLDLTSSLNEGARILIIINMFVGRIGLITVVTAMIPRDHRPASGRPKEDILLT